MRDQAAAGLSRTVTISVRLLVAVFVALAIVAALAYSWMQREIDEARLEGAASVTEIQQTFEENQRSLFELVARRELPPESLRGVAADGGLDFYSIVENGPCSPRKGCPDQVVTRWDMDGDGKREVVTEGDIDYRYSIRAADRD